MSDSDELNAFRRRLIVGLVKASSGWATPYTEEVAEEFLTEWQLTGSDPGADELVLEAVQIALAPP